MARRRESAAPREEAGGGLGGPLRGPSSSEGASTAPSETSPRRGGAAAKPPLGAEHLAVGGKSGCGAREWGDYSDRLDRRRGALIGRALRSGGEEGAGDGDGGTSARGPRRALRPGA